MAAGVGNGGGRTVCRQLTRLRQDVASLCLAGVGGGGVGRWGGEGWGPGSVAAEASLTCQVGAETGGGNPGWSHGGYC